MGIRVGIGVGLPGSTAPIAPLPYEQPDDLAPEADPPPPSKSDSRGRQPVKPAPKERQKQ